MRLINPFEQEGQWYKANLHTHTTVSDGNVSVEERVRQYREKGYSVLAITDHELTNDVRGLSTDDFLALGGMETHPKCEGGIDYHLVCLNIPHGLAFSKEVDAQTRIRTVKESGGEVIFAHPYWCGHTINDMLRIEGYIAMEVYNSTCTRIGKGISSVHWDDLLNIGKYIPAVASDDTHRGRDIFMGWTMVKARELTVPAVMDALRTGCFYASCGPTIESLHIEDGKAVLRCSPAAEVHFMSWKSTGDSLYADGGELITSAVIPLRAGSKYLRVEIVDSSGKRAWTNPLIELVE